MAAAPQNVYSEDIINGARLTALLINEGTEVVRKVFLKIISPDTLVNVLSKNQNILKALVPKILNNRQFLLLFPKSGPQPSIQDYDLTLMLFLIRNLGHLYGGLHQPNWPGWVNRPAPTDVSMEADLARLRLFRNELYGHVATTGINDSQFTEKWQELEEILVRLGADQSRINQWRHGTLNHQEVGHLKEVLTQQTKLIVDSLKDFTSENFERVDENLKKITDGLKVVKRKAEKQHGEHMALSKKTAKSVESLQALANLNKARDDNNEDPVQSIEDQHSSRENNQPTPSTEIKYAMRRTGGGQLTLTQHGNEGKLKIYAASV
ncbi:E3 ubiquitin-protein ligase DZIP3-like [Ptychodera flava]|uniref:E3 ubiquitin-protein ligase DZIP3-like n=1 Tax=Ptychodera flava TaxID=63121 RepID=UPI00396A93A9